VAAAAEADTEELCCTLGEREPEGLPEMLVLPLREVL
jgi:hypothetical protein